MEQRTAWAESSGSAPSPYHFLLHGLNSCPCAWQLMRRKSSGAMASAAGYTSPHNSQRQTRQTTLLSFVHSLTSRPHFLQVLSTQPQTVSPWQSLLPYRYLLMPRLLSPLKWRCIKSDAKKQILYQKNGQANNRREK